MYLIIRASKNTGHGYPDGAIVCNTKQEAQENLLKHPNLVFRWDGKETSPVEDNFWDDE